MTMICQSNVQAYTPSRTTYCVYMRAFVLRACMRAHPGHDLSPICAQRTHVHTEREPSKSRSAKLQVLVLEVYQSNCVVFSSAPDLVHNSLKRARASLYVGNVPNSRQENPDGRTRAHKRQLLAGRVTRQVRNTSDHQLTRNVHQTAMVDERLRNSSAEPSRFRLGIKPNERDTNFHFHFPFHFTVFTVEVPARCTKPYLPSPHVG